MSWLDNFFIKEVDNNSVKMPNRQKLNFIGATITDNPTTNATDVNVTASVGNAVVFSDVVLANSNIKTLRTQLSPIDSTKVGITNLGSSSAGTGGAFNDYCTISGGDLHNLAGNYSTISGGLSNTILNALNTISGGSYNTITINGSNSTISGGRNNSVANNLSVIAGGEYNNIYGANSVISGGSYNKTSTSLVSDGYQIIGGGLHNEVVGLHSSIFAGNTNKVNNDYGLVVSGINNNCGSISGTILNGNANTISTDITKGYSLVLNGVDNTNSPDYNTIVNGNGNTISASAQFSTIINGVENTIDGAYSLINGNLNSLLVNSDPLSNCNILGDSNSIDGSSFDTIIGDGNTIVLGNHNLVVGHDNNVDEYNGYTTIFGNGNYSKNSNKYGVIFGMLGSSRMPHQMVYAPVETSSSAGDNQISLIGLFGTGATGAAFTLTDSNGDSLVFEDNKAYALSFDILVSRSTAPSSCMRFVYDVLCHQTGSTLVIDVSTLVLSQDSAALGWTITLSASTNTLVVTVDASGANTRKALAKVTMIEVNTTVA